MTRTLDNHRLGTDTAVSVVLFLCLFAGQAGLIAISPLLSDVARDLDVSTAAAGQLRTIGGIGAAVTALLLGRVGRRFGLRTQLLAGSGFVALASVASAAAPTFAVLAVAQLPLGIGIATLTTAGTVAAAAWVPVERRRRVLSWALVGNPAAWIVGMPLIGLVGEQSWRLAWLALPLAAAVVAGAVLLLREADPPARTAPASVLDAVADPCLKRWLAAETLANAAWAGTLVYSGALFVESYGASARLTGTLLAIAAAAYVAGNLSFRRLEHVEPTRLLPPLLLALATTTALFGALRPSVFTSTVVFSAAAFAAGGRTLLSSALGLAAAPELRPAAMGARSASGQFGYFAGSLAGGAALAAGGYPAFGLVVGLAFVAAAAALAPLPRAPRCRSLAAESAL